MAGLEPAILDPKSNALSIGPHDYALQNHRLEIIAPPLKEIRFSSCDYE